MVEAVGLAMAAAVVRGKRAAAHQVVLRERLTVRLRRRRAPAVVVARAYTITRPLLAGMKVVRVVERCFFLSVALCSLMVKLLFEPMALTA